MKGKLLRIAALLLAACGLLLAGIETLRMLRHQEARRLFAAGNYQAALRLYSSATADPALRAYNRGTALYRIGDFRGAAQRFAAGSANELLAAPARYNLGVTAFRLARQREDGDPTGAAAFYGEARERFREALAHPATRDDAIHNLAVTEGRLALVGAKEEKKPDHGGRGDRASQGGAQEQEASGKGESTGFPKEPTGQPATTQAKGDRAPGSAGKREKALSRQEAEALLDEARQRERTAIGLMDRRPAAPSADMAKDW